MQKFGPRLHLSYTLQILLLTLIRPIATQNMFYFIVKSGMRDVPINQLNKLCRDLASQKNVTVYLLNLGQRNRFKLNE
jgi:hypothetical protein